MVTLSLNSLMEVIRTWHGTQYLQYNSMYPTENIKLQKWFSEVYKGSKVGILAKMVQVNGLFSQRPTSSPNPHPNCCQPPNLCTI